MLKINRPYRFAHAVHILPNVLTTANLFFGYFSIVKSIHGHFSIAAISILLAAVFDVLDGSVARLTKGTSIFGMQYDSICDIVSFGIAPAMIVYKYGLESLGRLGWVICFFPVACGALRLARFNTQSTKDTKNSDFVGLPITMFAGLIACFICLCEEAAAFKQEDIFWLWFDILKFCLQYKLVFMMLLLPILSILMVCNIPFLSTKSLHFKSKKPFRLLVILVTILCFIAYLPSFGGFLFFFIYAASGPFEWIMGWKKTKEEDEIFETFHNDDEDNHQD